MRNDTVAALEQVIQDYLQWMAVNGYAKSTQQDYRQCALRYFRAFIDFNRYHWDDIFTRRTLNRFKKAKGKHHTHAVTGLSRYLHAQGKSPNRYGSAKLYPFCRPFMNSTFVIGKNTAMHPIARQPTLDGCFICLIVIANETMSNFDH
jgi:hypothetical protein